MIRKLIILNIWLLITSAGCLFSQVKPVFSGDPEKFKDELASFMGPNLTEEQKTILNSFTAKWDSSAISRENKSKILDLSNQLTGRQMRAGTQFTRFLNVINVLVDQNKSEILNYWLSGLSEILFDRTYPNDAIVKHLDNMNSLVRGNTINNPPSVKWKIKNAVPVFEHDTTFRASVKNATLTCYSQRDSTEIYNVSGYFSPDLQIFHGTKGRVTWEKAGFAKEDVFADLTRFTVNTTKNSFTCDSARLFHKTYFKSPVYGILTDQAASIPNKERATYPRFETYMKKFRIKNIYKDVNYEGGLAFEGANVKGKGENAFPARISLLRNDSLFIKLTSNDFVFSAGGLNSQVTAATLYLGKDSIYHTDLGFSYNSLARLVNLYRTNNPVSGSPYYDSYHHLDMYFESLTWDMKGSKIIISRPKGAAIGEAKFESSDFFNSNYFLRLMGLDNEHPLTRFKKFSEWFYSETFPVSEFAKWLKKPEDVVTGMCIDMANKGFVFYDQLNGEVTLKKKTKDYIDSYVGKKDYDVLAILSETKPPVDNAILDLNNFDLTVNGVKDVYLSDSQRVAVYPYKQQIILEKNRNFKFDGVVEAGLFTIFGRNFEFSYDTFKLRLHNIDSIKIAVETEKRDNYGNPLIRSINSLIQLSKGEIYIDDPLNKSGLKSLAQYPIINATSPSYIFYDRIPGLEGVYSKKGFYFKIDPFIFENIDHYTFSDVSLSGEFYAGKILKPMRQNLTLQDNNSLGFEMTIPEDGIDIYEGKARFFDQIKMSNRGLIGSGTLKHLTSTIKSDEYKFFPDSMLTKAVTFNMDRDPSGLYPELQGQDIRIKWKIPENEMLAYNPADNKFQMFGNNTSLDGNLKLSPKLLSGTGIINTPESEIRSNLFKFRSNEIRADTATYNLKSPSTSGYAFIAENANTFVDFTGKVARFHLNTDSSLVKFPEIQFNCTMTDFEYNMADKVLNMEQRGKTASSLIPPQKLLQIDQTALSKPTFIATNSLRDTIAFTSLKAKYNVDKETIEAENISYIPIADALIQPENGKITIGRKAKIDRLKNAWIAVNRTHLLHNADIDIESARRYSGSAVYDYVDDANEVRQINFAEIGVDTMTTSAKGFIAADQKFMLSPAFTFTGDVSLSARSKLLMFTGSAGIINDCSSIKSYPVKFKSLIDPKNVMIPINEKPRDSNDNLVFSGTYQNLDSIHFYPAFLSQQKSYTDVGLVTSSGLLYFNKAKGSYQIAPQEKIADPSSNGNIVSLDRKLCTVSGEGALNLGTNFDLVKMTTAGNFTETNDSNKVNLNTIIALDFFFSPEALKVMSDEIRMMPTLKSVNINSEFYTKGMKDILGAGVAGQLKAETDLFGISGNMPKEFTYKLLLNDVHLRWNEASSSFRSVGKIGLGYVGNQPVNMYVDGFIEIQRRRSGDMFDIYLKADKSTWYYFSYFKGVMMAQAGDNNFNTILANLKLKDRKHPDSSVKVPYTYMIAVEDRLGRFLKRMAGEADQEPSELDNIIIR
ncbi:MAG: hypothetical protein Q8868_09255 [Bacteroidota bacterium]|nr:hypothetical protein [Bacteroidota bacterium]